MRILLFCVLLLVGLEMRADYVIPYNVQFNILIPQAAAIPASPLILFERVNEDNNDSLPRFGFEWARLIADGDTIPLKLIDSCAGKSCTQWLFKPEGMMVDRKQNFFCIYFGRYGRLYGTAASCFLMNNPIRDCAERNKPEMHGLPQLLETQDSAYVPFKKVFLRINATDENAMLLKAVYTDRATGEKYKRYFQLQSAKSDTGSVIDIGIIDLNTAHIHAIEITLIDLAGNQSAPILLRDDVRFNKGSRYVYAEENGLLTYLKMIGIIGLCILFALGYFHYRFRRITKKPN